MSSEVILLTAAFLIYIGAIPFVPFIGAKIYKRRNDTVRRNVCYGLTALQVLISIAYAIYWFKHYV